MNVLKRNGNFEVVSFDKVTKRLQSLCDIEPKLTEPNPYEVAKRVCNEIYDGIKTTELDELAANICTSKSTIEPQYGALGSRTIISNNHKNTNKSFSKTMKDIHSHKDQNIIADDIYKFINTNKKAIDGMIVHERDYGFDYFAFKTLEKAYLIKINGEIKERIQYLFMRVAIGIHWDTGGLEKIQETYDLMSQKYFTHATPTLFHASSKRPQLLSCFLCGMDDSIDGIYKCLSDCAQISKWAGGIGIHISNIRGNNSLIRGTNGKTDGIVPMLTVYNRTAKYVNQSGKRNGSFAIYIEPWHSDIEDFLELKKNHGDEEKRARELFYALWVPDLFMKRVKEKGKWSLFCPDEAKGLADTYGDEFEKLYIEYENSGVARKTIEAADLWKRIMVSQIETGSPYMLYKDSANKKSNQQNLGMIKSSNLCSEIIEYSDSKEYACCTLASIGLPAFVNDDGIMDYEKLGNVVRVITRNLNNVIDKNFYPVPETEISNKKHRPLGIGVQGLADVYCKMKLPFDSEAANLVNEKIFATIYYYAMEMSIEIAQEHSEQINSGNIRTKNRIEEEVLQLEKSRESHRGAYSSFIGSPLSQGKFQFDLWDAEPISNISDTLVLDWDKLRKNVVEHGARNSLLLAPMPTASTSQVLCNNECIEPFTTNIYARSTLAGTFEVVNKHLLRDLISLKLWNQETKNKLVLNRGSIQNIQDIPQQIKDVYKTSWELKQRHLIQQSITRGKYVCQSQSLNLFMEDPTFSKLSAMHFFSWENGLKTGLYYLRTKAKAVAQQFTVDPKLKNDCEFCSS